MALYHLSFKAISRKAQRSSTAAAAYRAGEKIVDARTGEIHDYRRKRGVEYTELILPDGCAPMTRSELWNGVEQHHKRGDALIARELEIALPEELTPPEREVLAVALAREVANHYQVAADVCLHAPDKKGDERNYHAHILLSACTVGANGFGKKAVELDPIHCKHQKIKIATPAELWRERFAQLQNEHLERAGSSARVDHRSLVAQGINRQATRHLGPAATGYERRTGQPSLCRKWHEQAATETNERLEKARAGGEGLDRLSDGELDTLILDLSGEMKAALAEQNDKQQIERAKKAQEQMGKLLQQAEDDRIARMTADELKAEIIFLRPKPLAELVKSDQRVTSAKAPRNRLNQQYQQAKQQEATAKSEAEAWRKAHPVMAKAYDAVGAWRVMPWGTAELDKLIKAEAQARSERQRIKPELDAAIKSASAVQVQVQAEVHNSQAPSLQRVIELERVLEQRQAAELAKAQKEPEMQNWGDVLRVGQTDATMRYLKATQKARKNKL